MLRLVLLCVAVVACSAGVTEAVRDPHCVYPGDSIGVLRYSDRVTHATISCTWLVSKVTSCGSSVVTLASATMFAPCPHDS